MRWLNVQYLSVALIPGIALLGWVLSELLRRSRLNRLGDPAVLGVPSFWKSHIARLALLLLGLSSSSAIFTRLPADRQEFAGSADMVLLLDRQAFESAEDPLWGMLDTTVQRVFGDFPGRRFALLSPALPLQPLIPSTPDAGGFRILLNRMRYEASPAAHVDIRGVLSEFASRGESPEQPSRLLVISAMPAEELERLAGMIPNLSQNVWFAQLRRENLSTKYGRRRMDGTWLWSPQLADVGNDLAASIRAMNPSTSWSAAQWLALLAFICFSAETMLHLFSPVTSRGRTLV